MKMVKHINGVILGMMIAFLYVGLYKLSGLMGTLLVISGLIMWAYEEVV